MSCGCEGRGARVCRTVKLRRNSTGGNARGRRRAGVRAGAHKGELHRAGGARVCRVVKLRGNSTGPGRASVLRRQAKGELDRAGARGCRAGVCRAVKLRGNSIGRGRAGVARV